MALSISFNLTGEARNSRSDLPAIVLSVFRGATDAAGLDRAGFTLVRAN